MMYSGMNASTRYSWTYGAPSGVRAGDEYAAVLEQDGLRVVEAVDGGVGQDCEAGVEGRSGVVKGRRCDSGS